MLRPGLQPGADDADAPRYLRAALPQLLFPGHIVEFQPAALRIGDNALGPEHRPEAGLVLQRIQDGFQLLCAVAPRGLPSPALEYLVRVMLPLVVMMVLMVVVVVVLMLVVVLMVMPVMVLVLMLAVAVVIVIVVIVIVVMVMVMRFLHQGFRPVTAGGSGGIDLFSGEGIPGGGDQAELRLDLPQDMDGGLQLLLAQPLGAAQHHKVCGGDLIRIEFPEILGVHPAAQGVRHGDAGAGPHIRPLQAGYGGGYVAELSHAGGLDEHPVRVESVQGQIQGAGKIPHQAAADAAGVHLRDLQIRSLAARLPEEGAVYADLAEFILDQHQLLAPEGLRNELFDERGLARPQEAGENIDHRQYDAPL